MPSPRQARLEQCFGHRRQCYDRYLDARRALDETLVRRNGASQGKRASASAFEQVVRLQHQCERADDACLDALASYAEEVLERARHGRSSLLP